MANIQYPAPLKVGSKIAVCSLSAGIKSKYHPRLDIVINGLKQRGYQVVEGEFLRQNEPRTQLTAKQHAKQLMDFLLDDEIGEKDATPISLFSSKILAISAGILCFAL